jgi:ABC-type uncharacterized transport system YnjBCD ATPase subunit
MNIVGSPCFVFTDNKKAAANRTVDDGEFLTFLGVSGCGFDVISHHFATFHKSI